MTALVCSRLSTVGCWFYRNLFVTLVSTNYVHAHGPVVCSQVKRPIFRRRSRHELPDLIGYRIKPLAPSLSRLLMLTIPLRRLYLQSKQLNPAPARMVSTSSPTNSKLPSVPRPSASLIVVNDRNEILLVQRNLKSRSFAGAQVRPFVHHSAPRPRV